MVDQAYDERNQRLRGTVIAIAEGVTAFTHRSGATVRVIGKESEAEWRRCAQRVGRTFTDTHLLAETLRRGLPELGRGSGWRSQRAAVDALAHPEAEYAVVAEAGADGPLTVVTFRRSEDGLVVVGGGTTFAPVPADVLPDSSLPSAEQAGYAAQYALASLAAQETRAITHQVSPDTWHGPRDLQARRMIFAGGRPRTAVGAQAWPAADVRHIAEQVALRQPDGRNPFPQVRVDSAGVAMPRQAATELKGWVDRGGTLVVYDHAVPEDRDAAGLAMLELTRNSEYLAQNPIPAKPGVRTVVAMSDGRPGGLLTVAPTADGNLHVLRFLSSPDAGAHRAIETVMPVAAGRHGGALTFSPAGALEYAKQPQFTISSQDAANRSFRQLYELGKLDKPAELRMTALLDVLDTSFDRTADPAELLEPVQAFRAAGGDVLYLSPSDPRFVALQERAAETVWAAAGRGGDGAVAPGVDGMWRAMNVPAEDGQMVAVAVLDGEPVAAAAVRDTGARYEVGTLGAVPEAGDALQATVVETAYSRGTISRPVVMYLPEAEAESEQLAAVGFQVTGARALDDESRVEVRLPEPLRQAVVGADVQSEWRSARWLDLIADSLQRFEDDNGRLVTLDHSVEADRVRAEDLVRDVQTDNPVGVPEQPLPRVNGNRVTVAARSEQYGPAYITFDETPEGGIEVVDVAAKGYDYTAREATRYWFCHELAQRGQDSVLHERIDDVERKRGTWQAGPGSHLVIGMRNRLGDRAAALLQQSGRQDEQTHEQPARRSDGQRSNGQRSDGQRSDVRRPDGRRRGGLDR